MSASTRPAVLSDVVHLVAFDHVAATEPDRAQLISRRVMAGDAFVFDGPNGVPVGFVLFNRSFFGHMFIELLYTRAADRRRGVGTALVTRCQSECRTGKLFTSTNRSNVVMQALLVKLGFVSSGVIENLDEGDPELVFFKQLSDQAR
jgi:ribosomal protein S18 acetylase RimI-like enzyme